MAPGVVQQLNDEPVRRLDDRRPDVRAVDPRDRVQKVDRISTRRKSLKSRASVQNRTASSSKETVWPA